MGRTGVEGDVKFKKNKKNSVSSVPRKQEQQRKKEYQQEIREMHRRVKGRPLLLEQVAQVSDISGGDSDH